MRAITFVFLTVFLQGCSLAVHSSEVKDKFPEHKDTATTRIRPWGNSTEFGTEETLPPPDPNAPPKPRNLRVPPTYFMRATCPTCLDYGYGYSYPYAAPYPVTP